MGRIKFSDGALDVHEISHGVPGFWWDVDGPVRVAVPGSTHRVRIVDTDDPLASPIRQAMADGTIKAWAKLILGSCAEFDCRNKLSGNEYVAVFPFDLGWPGGGTQILEYTFSLTWPCWWKIRHFNEETGINVTVVDLVCSSSRPEFNFEVMWLLWAMVRDSDGQKPKSLRWFRPPSSVDDGPDGVYVLYSNPYYPQYGPPPGSLATVYVA